MSQRASTETERLHQKPRLGNMQPYCFTDAKRGFYHGLVPLDGSCNRFPAQEACSIVIWPCQPPHIQGISGTFGTFGTFGMWQMCGRGKRWGGGLRAGERRQVRRGGGGEQVPQ